MRCKVEQALVDREGRIPALGMVLDPEAFRGLLSDRHPGLEVGGVRLDYLRYKPGTNLLAAYTVSVGGASVPVTAKAVVPSSFAWRGRTGGEGTGALSGFDDSHRGLMVRVYPEDPGIRALRKFADPGYRAGFFHRHRSLEMIPDSAGWVPLRYNPERRFVARLDGECGPVAVVKLHADGGYDGAQRGAEWVRSGESYTVPRCLHRSDRRRALVFGWENGVPLVEALSMGAGLAPVLRAVAAGLHELHGWGDARFSRRGLGPLAGGMAGHAQSLAAVMPSLRGRADRLAARLSAEVMRVEDRWGLIHGDFHAGQVLVRAGVPCFLDFDEACMGHPLVDLANFLAHLELGRLAGGLVRVDIGEATAALVEAYGGGVLGAQTGWLRVLVAALLFSKGLHPFRVRSVDWPQTIVALVERVGELLGEGCRVRTVVDPALPFLREALDGPSVARKLKGHGWFEALGAAGEVEVRSEVVRHKPGRRCLIEYELGTGMEGRAIRVLGKMNARRDGSRVDAIARQLRRAGLDGSDGVGVPESLGVVKEWKLHVQRKVSGAPATAGFTTVAGPGLAARCAEAVDRLHRSGVVVEKVHGVAEELALLGERLERVGRMRPEWRGRLADLVSRCDRLGAEVGVGVEEGVLIHRDYYPDQVLVDDGRLWVVDLDLASMGDPCLDHGNFMAHLAEQSVREPGRSAWLAASETSYCSAAMRCVGGGAGARVRLGFYTVVALARHVYISSEFEDRRGATGRLLEESERRLETLELRVAGGVGVDVDLDLDVGVRERVI